MFNVKILYEQINRIRKKKNVLTNNFLSLKEVEEFSQMSDSKLIYDNEIIVIYVKDNGINRIYFYVDDIKNIENLKNILEKNSELNTSYIIDCLGTETFLNELKTEFCKNGIKFYKKLNRWQSTQLTNLINFNSSNLRIAKLEDLNSISSLLKEVMDPLIAHLPTEVKLQNLIKNNLVFCAEFNDKIIGVYCMENVGSNGIYLYQDGVLPDYQGTGIGVKLLHFALNRYPQMKRYTAWIEENKKKKKKMNSFVGLKKDKLIEYVFIYKREESL